MNLKKMKTEDLVKKRKEIQDRIKDLDDERDKIINRMIPLFDIERQINEAIDERTLSFDDPTALLEKFPETKPRRKLFKKYIESIGLNDAGSYWRDTNQSCVRIKLYKNSDAVTKLAHEGILQILPYIKPLNDGKKTFDIFEHTLSASYSYYLKVSDDDKLFEVATHTGRVLKSSTDLMKVLIFIQKELYYERDYPF